MRGALITVRCDCGGIGYVPYDERWECPTCHRRWNTGQIPAEEYWGIMRDMRRMRINVLATALGIVIPIVVLSVVLGFRILLLLPVVMSFWFLFYMPRWRRRVRQQARNLQRWQLHPPSDSASGSCCSCSVVIGSVVTRPAMRRCAGRGVRRRARSLPRWQLHPE